MTVKKIIITVRIGFYMKAANLNYKANIYNALLTNAASIVSKKCTLQIQR